MAWPSDPLPIAVELWTGAEWEDITRDVRAGDGAQIAMTRGQADEASAPEPGSITATLANADGRYSPRNPMSDLYGNFGRNTPIRVRITGGVAGDGFAYMPRAEVVDDRPSVPDDVSLDITGDIDIRIDLALDGWAGTTSTLCGKYSTVSNQRSWALLVRPDGTVQFTWSTDGTSAGLLSATSTVAASIVDGQRIAIRATLDVNNGASGHTTTFYTSDTIDGSWAQLGTAVTVAGTTSIFASTALLDVGRVGGFGTSTRKAGRVYGFELRDSIGGTVVANPDFGAVEPTATEFTDSAGQVWTLNGLCRVVRPDIRGIGEVSEWPPRWDVSGQDATTSLKAQGILRRLGQGNRPLMSPLHSANLRAGADGDLVAYWTLEDATDATYFASALPGGSPMTWTGEAPDHGEDGIGPLLGSDKIALLAPTTSLAGSVPPATAGTVAVRMVMDLPDSPTWPDGTPILRLNQSTSGSTVATWEVRYRTGWNLDVRALDPTGAQLATSGTLGFGPMSGNILLTFGVVQSGSDAKWTLYVRGVDLDTGDINDGGGFFDVTMSGLTVTYATQVRVAPNSGLDGLAVGHVLVSMDAALGDAYYNAGVTSGLNAFKGEPAATRAARLADEVGVVAVVIGDPDDSIVMGRQPIPGLFADNLAETYAADSGLLFETRDQLGLTFHGIRSLCNQPVALQLAYDGAGEIAADLEPVDDDQRLRNKVAITRKSADAEGSSATWEDSTSRMGTQAPPEGVGVYEDSAQLNITSDDDLIHHAAWRVHVGTWDEARYPLVRINLTALARQGKWSLIAAAAALNVGERLRLVNLPVWTGADGGTVDLLCLGFTETFDYPNGWVIEINTVPYGPYHVRQSATSTPSDLDGRYTGDDACAIRADIDEDDTSIAFDPNLFRWASVLVRDTFTRSVSNDWGTPDIGSAWVAQTPSWYSVTGGKGKIVLSSADSDHLDSTTATYRDVDMWVTVTAPVTAAGASYTVSLVRVSDPGSWGNGYRLMAEWTTSGTVNLLLQSLAAGTLVTASAVTTYSPGDTFRLRFQIVGPQLAGKVWNTTVGEPDWQVAAVDTAETAGAVEIRVARNSGNTNANLTLLFDDLFVGSPGTSPGDFPMPVRLVHAPGITGGGELVTVSSIATTEPTVVAAGAMSSADNTSVTPALYSGHTSGDWICVWAGKDGTGGTLTTPTGYSRVVLPQGKGYLFAKRHGSSESAPTITPSGGSSGDTVSAVTFGLRNMPTTLTPDKYVVDHAGQSNSSAQNIAYPGLAAGIQWGRVILLLARKSDDDTGIAAPSGFTELSDTTTTTGNDQSLWVGYRIDTAPTPIAAGSLTVTGGASAVSDSLVVALAGGYQTATVTRSANAVEKAHSAGTRLAVEDVLTLAL